MVATSDPLMKNALTFFKAAYHNAFVGCLWDCSSLRSAAPAPHAAPGDGCNGPAHFLRSAYLDHVAAGADHRSLRHLCRNRTPLATEWTASRRLRVCQKCCLVALWDSAVAWLVSVVWPLPDPEAKGQRNELSAVACVLRPPPRLSKAFRNFPDCRTFAMHAIDVEDPVQVIDLVLQDACVPSFRFDPHWSRRARSGTRPRPV